MRIKFPLIVTDKGVRNSGTLGLITDQLFDYDFSILDDVKPKPNNKVVKRCFKVYQSKSHDAMISISGGSALDIRVHRCYGCKQLKSKQHVWRR